MGEKTSPEGHFEEIYATRETTGFIWIHMCVDTKSPSLNYKTTFGTQPAYLTNIDTWIH